ncbi:DUF5007 domain-containing protein [Paraflavitalea pollutisoli]|uniref:DUF5007 domain-containing protein n=1 Tax=Paraflavitalea pollutisoli TaxID=3034143 RepID=UPI0023ED385F|nr:DUF5007 domain-containing protein [Paraflavitalea sp. H1-2-19X]
MNHKQRRLLTQVLATGVLLSLLGACTRLLPEYREALSLEAGFSQTTFEPVVGRTTMFSNVFVNPNNSSTYPIDFTIVNARRFSGEAAPELSDIFPVKVWKQAYTGNETSVAEIEAKRVTEYHNLFEVRKHSGDFVLWSSATSNLLRCQADSGYIFDVEMSNGGGRRYFRNMRLMPFRERPYEPSNLNAITGQSVANGIYPSTMIGVVGDSTNQVLSAADVDVFIRKSEEGKPGGNTISFMFLDKYFRPIDPAKFADTDWNNLLHGFNMTKTATRVTYDVAFPVPAVPLATRFTTADGRRATTSFAWSRLGYGGLRQEAEIGLNFAIYEPGNWEIVFAFKKDNPKFSND